MNKIVEIKTIDQLKNLIKDGVNIDTIVFSSFISTCTLDDVMKLRKILQTHNRTFTPIDFMYSIRNPNNISYYLLAWGVKANSNALFQCIKYEKYDLFKLLLDKIDVTYCTCINILTYEDVRRDILILMLKHYDYNLTIDKEYLEELVIGYDNVTLFNTLVYIGHELSSSSVEDAVERRSLNIVNYILGMKPEYRDKSELIYTAIDIYDTDIRLKMVKLLISYDIPFDINEVFRRIGDNNDELKELFR